MKGTEKRSGEISFNPFAATPLNFSPQKKRAQESKGLYPSTLEPFGPMLSNSLARSHLALELSAIRLLVVC